MFLITTKLSDHELCSDPLVKQRLKVRKPKILHNSSNNEALPSGKIAKNTGMLKRRIQNIVKPLSDEQKKCIQYTYVNWYTSRSIAGVDFWHFKKYKAGNFGETYRI